MKQITHESLLIAKVECAGKTYSLYEPTMEQILRFERLTDRWKKGEITDRVYLDGTLEIFLPSLPVEDRSKVGPIAINRLVSEVINPLEGGSGGQANGGD